MAIDVKFTNNARTLLSTSSVSTSATSISVDDGSVFPSLSGSSYFYATLQRAADSTAREIVKVTARSGNDLTIARAQDNTSALTFIADDIVEIRIVAKAFEDIITDVDLKSTASSPDFSGPISIAPSENTTKVLTVTVASKTNEHPFDSGSTNAYFIDGVEAPYLLLTPDTTYRFDQADASNDGHPFRFYYESDKTTAYSTGVTTNGTPGNAGAYTEIKATEATPTVLHYQCSSHALMGNKVSFIFRTDENIQDLVGSMFSSNTETGITATYQDSDGTIDLVVDTSATTETLTNKTFDVEGTGNSISNIDVADLKSGVLDTDISSVSGSDDTLASAKSIKTYVDAQDAAIASDTLTFTNKTFDVEGTGNSISNIDVADLKSGVLDTDISSVSGSDDTLASAKAIKTYVDANAGATALDDIGTGDAASTLATSAGNITIDAQGSDTDIILKGTDGSSDITGIKIDMSETAQVQFPNDSQALAFGADQDVLLTHVADTGLTLSSGTNDTTFQIDANASDAGVAPFLILNRTSDSPANSDAGGQISFVMENNNNEQFTAGAISVVAGDVSDGAEDGSLYFGTMSNGSFINALVLNGGDAGTASFSHDISLTTACFILHGGTLISSSYKYNFPGYALFYHKSTVSNAGVFARFDNSAGSMVGYISFNNTATAYVTSSDYRLKENIVDISDGITRLKQLQPRKFNFKVEPSTKVDGFLAHEVSSIVPEAITGTKDEMIDTGTVKDKNGKIIGTDEEKPEDLAITGFTFEKTGETPKYQGIDQAKLVPLLTAALQEAVAKIEALEARVTTLEG